MPRRKLSSLARFNPIPFLSTLPLLNITIAFATIGRSALFTGYYVPVACEIAQIVPIAIVVIMGLFKNKLLPYVDGALLNVNYAPFFCRDHVLWDDISKRYVRLKTSDLAQETYMNDTLRYTPSQDYIYSQWRQKGYMCMSLVDANAQAIAWGNLKAAETQEQEKRDSMLMLPEDNYDTRTDIPGVSRGQANSAAANACSKNAVQVYFHRQSVKLAVDKIFNDERIMATRVQTIIDQSALGKGLAKTNASCTCSASRSMSAVFILDHVQLAKERSFEDHSEYFIREAKDWLNHAWDKGTFANPYRPLLPREADVLKECMSIPFLRVLYTLESETKGLVKYKLCKKSEGKLPTVSVYMDVL